MLWRFRREIIFVVEIIISIVILKHQYMKKVEDARRISESKIPTINYEELIAENIRLKEILGITKEISTFKKTVIAQVISIEPRVFPAVIVIDKGIEDGIKENMTVLSKDMCLIGRIINVEKSVSMVMTIFNKNSKVSVVVDRTREIGILEGGSVPALYLRYIPYDSQVQAGDSVITSGYSDFYPRGIKVGKIVRVKKSPDSLFLKVYVKPLSCFSGLEEVIIGE